MRITPIDGRDDIETSKEGKIEEENRFFRKSLGWLLTN
jgi:hypothetical protein